MNDPLNIAVVGACPYPVPQGSQVYLRNTALAFAEAGHDPRLVVYGYGVGEAADDLPVHRGMNVPGARKTAAGPSWAKPLQDVFLVRELQHVVREYRVDVVDAHNYEGLMVALAARRRPILYHAHNALADELPHYLANPDQAATLGRWFDTTFPKRADHIVTPHDRLKEYLVDAGCGADRISTIPPWIEADAFAQVHPERTDAAMLYAGNLDEYQNVPLLYPVADAVREAEPGTQWVVATADERFVQMPPLVERARRVKTKDLGALRLALGQDVIFVCPRVSWSGYPIKLLNAMAAGLAIVCCESSAHPLVHQYSGLIVPDNDADAFTHSVLRLMRDPELRRVLGAHAWCTIEEHHTRQGSASRLNDVVSLLHAPERVL